MPNFAASLTNYDFGVVHTTGQVTIVATANDDGASVSISPGPSDSVSGAAS